MVYYQSILCKMNEQCGWLFKRRAFGIFNNIINLYYEEKEETN